MHKALTALLILAQLADAALTYTIIRRGGYEQNKWLVKLADFLSGYTKARWAWLGWSKGIAIVATWVIYVSYPQALPWLCMIYGGVVVHNVIEYFKQRGAN